MDINSSSFSAYFAADGVPAALEELLAYFNEKRPNHPGRTLSSITRMLRHFSSHDTDVLAGSLEYRPDTDTDGVFDRRGSNRVVVISSSLSEEMLLYRAAHPSVSVILYDAGKSSLDDLRRRVATMCSPPADSIAFVDHGSPGTFQLTHGAPINRYSLQRPEVVAFFQGVGRCIVPDGSIDLLACTLGGSPEDLALINELERIAARKVSASTNITGLHGDFWLETGSVDVACKYFDSYLLHNWQSNAAGFQDAADQLIKWCFGGNWTDIVKFGRNIIIGITSKSDDALKKIQSQLNELVSVVGYLADDIMVKLNEARQTESYSFIMGQVDNAAAGKLDPSTLVTCETHVNSLFSCLLGGDINDANARLDESSVLVLLNKQLRRERVTCDRYLTRILTFVIKIFHITSAVAYIFAGSGRPMALKQCQGPFCESLHGSIPCTCGILAPP